MNLTCQERDGALVASVSGPIDHENADAFQASLLPAVGQAAAAEARLILDLHDVDYMSSVGLRVLMRALNEARAKSVGLVVADLNGTMREIFEISRFDKLLEVFDSVEDALSG
ncbi:MAG: STAS domain-containing protein [Pseudomonadota bacterium]